MSDTAASDDAPQPLSQKERTRALDDLLARHTSQLAEHFVSVQILATRLEQDGTTTGFAHGSGDFYARKGICEEWIKNGDSFDDQEEAE